MSTQSFSSNPPSPPPPPITGPVQAPSGDGLATWAIAAGLVGLVTSFAGGGLLFGLIGYVLATMAQSRPTTSLLRVRTGLGLSLAGILVSVYVVAGSIGGLFGGGMRAWEGVPAPDFSVTTVDGKLVRLSELRGKRVFVDVWATWCPPCRAMLPDLNRLAKEWAAKDVVVVGLSADESVTDLETFAEQHRFEYAVGHMGKDFVAPYSEVNALPTLFVVDKNGVFIAIEMGQHSFKALTDLAELPDYPGKPKPAPSADSGR